MPLNLKPTETMAAEAARGLKWREEYNRGGTAVGVARARDISNRSNLSESTIKRMVSYFARHEVDKQGKGFSPGEEGFPSAGRIAWALWGGDPGKSWAEEKARQIDKEKENNGMKIEIQNKSGVLKLNSGVSKESADKLIDDLDRLYGQSAVLAQMSIGEIVCSDDEALESVEVEINSPGGSVFEGQRIYNALRSMSARGVEITTRVNGLAASMGSVILMAGDKKEMTAGSRIMIHEASTIAAGDARALRRQSELLEGISQEIAGIYAEKTGNDAKAVRKMMMEETWMNADEAKSHGFVDSIIKNGKEFDKDATGMTGILAKLFPGNDEAAKIEAAIVENDSLRADLDAANKQISELQSLAEVNAALQSDLSTAQATISDLQAKAEQSAAVAVDLENAAIINEQKVAEKAAELLASTGHPEPVAVAEASEEPTLREKYAKLTTPTDRAAFRKAHWNNLIQH